MNKIQNYYNYIHNIVNEHKIVAFIKGEKTMPACGFSSTIIQILNRFNINYYTINILNDDNLKDAIKIYSQWPTIPQIYIDGKFIGGSDIVLQLYEENQLGELLEKGFHS